MLESQTRKLFETRGTVDSQQADLRAAKREIEVLNARMAEFELANEDDQKFIIELQEQAEKNEKTI